MLESQIHENTDTQEATSQFSSTIVFQEEFKSKIHLETQKKYITGLDSEYRDQILELNPTIPMGDDVKLTIGIPVHAYPHIYQTLESYTVKQKNVIPELYEIVLLINRPNEYTPFDQDTLNQIEQFQKDHPQYTVHTSFATFDFSDKILMGRIYKLLWDIILYRNISREKEWVENDNIDNLVMRLSGSDSTKKNPNFLSFLINAFTRDPELARLTSESRMDPLVAAHYPLLYISYTLENIINRFWTKGKENSNLWNGTFRAHMYSHIWGHNPNIHIMEDIDLITRMKKAIKNNLLKDKHVLSKNAIDNSCDRAIASILKWGDYFNRYDNSFTLSDDTKTQSRELGDISAHKNSDRLELTIDNLQRELSAAFNLLFTRVARSSGIYKEFCETCHDTIKRRQKQFDLAKSIFKHSMFHGLGISIKYYNLFFDPTRMEKPVVSLSDDLAPLLHMKIEQKRQNWGFDYWKEQ